jgi:hypothetical protein
VSTSPISSIFSLLGPILLLIIGYVIVLIAAYRFGAPTVYAKAFFKSSTPAAILAVINSGGVYLIVLAISAQFANNPLDFAYSVASATFGLALGWVLGIIISPSSTDEASEFSLVTKAISTFVTGYALGYLKDVKLENIQHFLSQPQVPFRLMIAAACCLSTIAVVFISRRAEAVKANATREWFISYKPTDPKHAEALPGDVLARGPFSSREDALAEIARIKAMDQYKGLALTAVRVDILSEETVASAAAGTPAAAGSNDSAAAAATSATTDAAPTNNAAAGAKPATPDAANTASPAVPAEDAAASATDAAPTHAADAAADEPKQDAAVTG